MQGYEEHPVVGVESVLGSVAVMDIEVYDRNPLVPTALDGVYGADRDVVEYAEDAFGFKKSSTYTFIALCERFSKRTQRGSPYMFIDEKWKGYTLSQLTEMLSMDE